jgi:hypothetical protein
MFSQAFKLGLGKVITYEQADQEGDEERGSEQESHDAIAYISKHCCARAMRIGSEKRREAAVE